MSRVTGKVTLVPEDQRFVREMFGREFVVQPARNENEWAEWAIEYYLPELETVVTRIGNAESTAIQPLLWSLALRLCYKYVRQSVWRTLQPVMAHCIRADFVLC